MFCEVGDLVTYIILAHNDKTDIRSSQRMNHQKGLHATVTLVFDIKVFNVVTSTLKS